MKCVPELLLTANELQMGFLMKKTSIKPFTSETNCDNLGWVLVHKSAIS